MRFDLLPHTRLAARVAFRTNRFQFEDMVRNMKAVIKTKAMISMLDLPPIKQSLMRLEDFLLFEDYDRSDFDWRSDLDAGWPE